MWISEPMSRLMLAGGANLVDRVNALARSVPTWPIYLAGLIYPALLFWQAITGALGADPVKAMEHALGIWALRLIVLGLAITPARRLLRLNLMKFRRAIGLVAFWFVCLHFLTWAVLDMGLLWGQIAADIAKRPYVTAGIVGLLALIPLAATSTDSAIRRMGPVRWRRLHRLVHVAALAGAIHYVWLVKAWPVEPFIYLGLILAFQAIRLRHFLRIGWQAGSAG
ncbi:sulfoxide reductase heme-binding subunit YedZ [Albidovulum inexpectatum]|uniref:Protein-methionine-sulfoxide reductase heme-binding subunit MsrQ n=2 Tax=Albidovulum inexpectatum TaxID=196587 RepID=A0A2S5JE23_9RHOB|nr:sulfoxide reductase heme-binding subunit YedZ [Albidovulum inexpectatum]